MATEHEIIGEEWKERAPELAEWAMRYLVNRKDVWGQYSVLTPSERIREGRSYKAMTLPRKDMRGEGTLAVVIITSHRSLVCILKVKKPLACGWGLILIAITTMQPPQKIMRDVISTVRLTGGNNFKKWVMTHC